MTPTPTPPAAVDRAALVRSALRDLVAENGLHGTPMSAVAARAGVATGTAYVHYASKDDLVLAAYREAKVDLGHAAVACMDPDTPPATRFEQLWLGVHDHLTRNPELARFLTQVESSPYARLHHDSVDDAADPLTEAASVPDMAAELLPLPLEVLFDLGLAPAIRLVSAGVELRPTTCGRSPMPVGGRSPVRSVGPRQPARRPHRPSPDRSNLRRSPGRHDAPETPSDVQETPHPHVRGRVGLTPGGIGPPLSIDYAMYALDHGRGDTSCGRIPCSATPAWPS